MKTKLLGWVTIVLMMATIVAASDDGFIPLTLGVREDIVDEILTNAALAGYCPQEVKIYDRPWVPKPGVELVIQYLDDDIVASGRQQEVADDLYTMAWNACAARPETVDQIWVGVTCTANPNFSAGHGCALGQRIGHPP
jgi:hypothetical protein